MFFTPSILLSLSTLSTLSAAAVLRNQQIPNQVTAAQDRATAIRETASFAGLRPGGACNPAIRQICANGGPAQCVNGRVVSLSRCPNGQTCMSLPLVTRVGTTKSSCDTLDDGARRLGLNVQQLQAVLRGNANVLQQGKQAQNKKQVQQNNNQRAQQAKNKKTEQNKNKPAAQQNKAKQNQQNKQKEVAQQKKNQQVAQKHKNQEAVQQNKNIKHVQQNKKVEQNKKVQQNKQVQQNKNKQNQQNKNKPNQQNKNKQVQQDKKKQAQQNKNKQVQQNKNKQVQQNKNKQVQQNKNKQVQQNKNQRNGAKQQQNNKNQLAQLQQANKKRAIAENKHFGTLRADTACNPQVDAIACVKGKFARCVQGKFVLQNCAQGTVCLSLPLVNKLGTSKASCDSIADGAQRLGINQNQLKAALGLTA